MLHVALPPGCTHNAAMRLSGTRVIDLSFILGVAAVCWVPTPWVAFPAAVVLVLWLPGRFVLRLLRGLEEAPGGFWLAVILSLVLMPVPLSWLWWVSNDRWAVWGAVVGINMLLWLADRRPRVAVDSRPTFSGAGTRWLLFALAAWLGVCVFASYWLPQAGGRIEATPAHDYVKHHAVMLSLQRRPLPLGNVFFAVAADSPHYYYEYYYLVPAALRALVGNRVSIPFALGFSSAVVCMACVVFVYMLGRDFLGTSRGGLLAAACVGVVGGWDVIPVAIRAATGARWVVTLDSWCPVAWRVHNLATQYIWCPQHVVAVLALLLVVWLLRRAPRAGWWVVMAPLIGAFIFGSSVYLAMTIFLSAGVYVLLRLSAARKAEEGVGRALAAVAVIVLLGFALMAMQAWHYYEMSGRYDGGLTLHWDRFPFAFLGRLLPPGPLANWLDMPWILVVDFGLSAMGLLFIKASWWNRVWRDDGMRLLLIAGVTGTMALFTVRSDINPIDYSFRVSIMPAMVLGAIAAGGLLEPELVRAFVRKRIKGVVAAGVLLGLPVGLYEAPVTGARTLLQSRAPAADAGAIRFLKERTPANAVVQGDPKDRVTLVQLTNRITGVLDPDNPHVVVFRPPSVDRMRRAFDEVEAAFQTSSAGEAFSKLRRWRITYVLVGEVERGRFGALNQFVDSTYFANVYNDGRAAVYRLIARDQNGAGEREAGFDKPAGGSP
jgi:hypothetical protein